MPDNLNYGLENTPPIKEEVNQVQSEHIDFNQTQDFYIRALQESLKEMDTIEVIDIPEYTKEEIPNVPERKIYQDILKETVKLLNQSEAVKKGRRLVRIGKEIDEYTAKGIFQAYDRALKEAMRQVKINEAQRLKIKSEILRELNYSLRSAILQSIHSGGGEALRPKIWAILATNPSKKLYQYLDSKMMKRVIRNSLIQGNVEQVKADLRAFVCQKNRNKKTDSKVAQFLAEVEKDQELNQYLPKTKT